MTDPEGGAQVSGIAEVARLAGVSKSTASRALGATGYVSDETRQRVHDAAASIGYVPSTSAVSLATGRTQNVGVVMPYVNRWFFAEVLEGIQQVLLERGLDLTLYDAKPGTDARNRIFEDFLARKRCDGLIAVGLEPDHKELDRLITIGRPIVSVVGSGTATTVVEIADGDRCCGAAGIYAATQPELAEPLGAQKATAIGATGATVVASANPGCSVQIAHHLGERDVEVVHPIELLDRAIAD